MGDPEARGELMITVEVPSFGTYQSDNDLYDEAINWDTEDLRQRVMEVVETKRGAVRHLLHCELAGMVAEWNTGARTNERQAEKASLHVRPIESDSYPQGVHIPQERIEQNAEVIARKMTVVTNVSDLTPAMRTCLLEYGTVGVATTIDALRKRGLVDPTSRALTNAGRRVAEALRAKMAVTPVDTVRLPRDLVDGVTRAWDAAHEDRTLSPAEHVRRFDGLRQAFQGLRDDDRFPSSDPGWRVVSRALLYAAKYAAHRSEAWQEIADGTLEGSQP
jgi:hypothetical protein